MGLPLWSRGTLILRDHHPAVWDTFFRPPESWDLDSVFGGGDGVSGWLLRRKCGGASGNRAYTRRRSAQELRVQVPPVGVLCVLDLSLMCASSESEVPPVGVLCGGRGTEQWPWEVAVRPRVAAHPRSEFYNPRSLMCCGWPFLSISLIPS